MLTDENEEVLKKKREEIRVWLDPYLVPLFFFDKLRETPDPAGMINGSGVLAKIDNDFFILTAGHCINEWIKLGLDYAVIALEPQIQCVTVVGHGCIYQKDEADFGYLKLSPQAAGVLESLSKQFLTAENISTSPPGNNARMIISGFPKKEPATEFPSHRVLQGLSLCSYLDKDSFKVWVGAEELETVLGVAEAHMEPQSGGISGGGCWLVGDVLSPQWKPDSMHLFGIHFYALRDLSGAGHYKIEMLVSKHLQLLSGKGTPEVSASVTR